MDLFVGTNDLKKALSQLLPITRSRSAITATNFIKMVAEEDKLSLYATDLEVWADKVIPATVSTNGTLHISAQLLNDLISTIQSPDTKMKADGDNIIIDAQNIHATVNGLASADYPEILKVNDQKRLFDIQSKLFIHDINQVIDAVSDDNSRAVLTTLCLHDQNGKLYLVATDGHRLARQMVMKNNGHELSLLLPAKAMQHVIKLFAEEEDLTLSYNDTIVIFSADNTNLTARLGDGTYPDYTQLLPTEYATRIQGDKNSIENALRSALVFSKSEADSAMLIVSESEQMLAIEGRSTDNVGSARTTTEIHMAGKPVQIRVNGRFSLTALGHIESDDVSIGMNGDLGPITFAENLDNNDYVHIVMPLKKT